MAFKNRLVASTQKRSSFTKWACHKALCDPIYSALKLSQSILLAAYMNERFAEKFREVYENFPLSFRDVVNLLSGIVTLWFLLK